MSLTVQRKQSGSTILALLRAREVGIALLIVLVVAVTALHNHGFIGADSIQQLLSGAALIALLGVGETLVIVTRNVDLSVGSVLGLSAYIVGDLFKNHHIPVWSGFVIAILIGVLAGAVNGFVVTVMRVPSLVVTLGMLYVIRGIDGVIVNGDRIDPGAIPSGFTDVGYKDFLGIPWLAIIVAVIVVAAGYAMRTFRASRDLYAIGSNPDAAALVGIPIERRVFTAFVISGGLAGFAGALFLALHTQIDNSGGLGYELSVVAAVVVGGVAIFGGSGTVVGAALGAILLNTINQALVASRISAFWNQAIAGALLLAAIAFDRWLTLRVTKTLQSAEGPTVSSEVATFTPDKNTDHPAAGNGNQPLWRSAARWESGLVVVFIGVLIFGTTKSATFTDPSTIFYLGINTGFIAIMALPMTFVVMTGEIDLSVASMLGLSGATVGYLWHHGWGIWPTFLAAIVVGIVGGALNGMLIARFGLPSIAVTIGTLTLFRGLAEVLLGSLTVPGIGDRPFPATLTNIGANSIPGTQLSWSLLIFIVLAAIFGVILHLTPLGRSMVAIGLQPEAAQFAGIRVVRIKFWLFVVSGIMSAFAGILLTLQNASVSYSAGTGLELNVVAIVLFGGVSIFGGRGTIIGVVLSVAIVGSLQMALTQINVSADKQNIVTGVLLLISVIVPNAGEAIRRGRERVKRRPRTRSARPHAVSSTHAPSSEGKATP